MSDFDQTILSEKGASGFNQTPGQEPKKRNPLLIIGGIGCALLLCIALLAGGGAAYFMMQGDNAIADLLGGGQEAVTVVIETPTLELAEPTSAPVMAPTDEGAEAASETEEAVASDSTPTAEEETTAVSSEPEMGPITFALGATDDYKPVDPGEVFEEGITEIHAIFDYNGMSKDYTWERVWYLDGEEILRNAAEWTDPAMGRFDYFLDAGGDPLPSGDWDLEIYVEDELLVSGTFTIKGEEEPTPVVKAETPTATPTSEPTETATPKPAASSSGGGTYKLVYTKWDGGQHNMYVADTNGNNERFMLNRAAGPSWTPDGAEIFFFGEEGIDRQKLPDGREFVFDGVSNGIVAMVNASALPNTEDAILFQGVDWKQGTARWANVSPNGQMVAFDAKPGGDYRIYFLGTADNQQFRYEILGEQADWSPDSQKIVYRSGRDGKTGIWISNRDDSGHTSITNGGSDSFPAWSPDGRKIAFSRDEGGNVDIYLMDIDGSNIQRLTETPGPDTLPVFTPSGDIVFRSARSGSWGIWKMSGAGANQTEIIPNAGVGPDWSYSKMDVR
jgi:Tol biopolymer transport system component